MFLPTQVSTNPKQTECITSYSISRLLSGLFYIMLVKMDSFLKVHSSVLIRRLSACFAVCVFNVLLSAVFFCFYCSILYYVLCVCFVYGRLT